MHQTFTCAALITVVALSAVFGCGGAQPMRTGSATPAAPDHERPSRDEVLAVMNSIRPRVQACATGERGSVQVAMLIESGGSIRDVRITGAVDGTSLVDTPAGECISQVARSARFTPFRRREFTVSFPFVLGRLGPPLPPASPPSQTIEGDLLASDIPLADGSVADDHTLSLRAGQTVTIVVSGGDSTSAPGTRLDMYTILLLRSREVTHDDDSAGDLNSRIIVTARETADYVLRVTTYGSGLKTGHYTISIWNGAEPAARDPHPSAAVADAPPNASNSSVALDDGAGALDSAAVAHVVRANLAAIRGCYETGLQRVASLAGQLRVHFTIGNDGRVSAVQTIGLETAPEVGACVAQLFRSRQFPVPQGGPVDFTFPFNFSPE